MCWQNFAQKYLERDDCLVKDAEDSCVYFLIRDYSQPLWKAISKWKYLT